MRPEPAATAYVLAWGADDDARVAQQCHELLALLGDVSPDGFGAFARAWTDRHGHGTHGFGGIRAAAIASDPVEAVRTVRLTRPVRAAGRPITLLFPGQGSQHAGMATGLYGHEPAFTMAMDHVFETLGPRGEGIRADWLSPRPLIGIDDVRRAQPLLFAVGYALSCTLRSWGVRPSAVLGHSIGELVAATVSGIFPLADAVRVLNHRVELIANTVPGGMLAVLATVDELHPHLRDDVVVAAVNARRQTVLSGPRGPLAEVAAELRTAGFLCRAARATSAFHSPTMDGVVTAGISAVALVTLKTPTIPLYSAYTGGLITADLAMNARFWAAQPAAPVLFGPTLDALLDTGAHLLVEAGARSLAVLARRHGSVVAQRSDVTVMLPNTPPERVDDNERRTVLTAAARIWTEGHDVDWDAVRRTG